MLQQMRDGFRYLKWLLVIIIFMFIWWAFATWGGGASRGRHDDAWAARVNGVTIPSDVFQSAARQMDTMYQSLLGEQYAQQRARVRIGQQTIGTLVEQELIYQEARRQGITVTPLESWRRSCATRNSRRTGGSSGPPATGSCWRPIITTSGSSRSSSGAACSLPSSAS